MRKPSGFVDWGSPRTLPYMYKDTMKLKWKAFRASQRLQAGRFIVTVEENEIIFGKGIRTLFSFRCLIRGAGKDMRSDSFICFSDSEKPHSWRDKKFCLGCFRFYKAGTVRYDIKIRYWIFLSLGTCIAVWLCLIMVSDFVFCFRYLMQELGKAKHRLYQFEINCKWKIHYYLY